MQGDQSSRCSPSKNNSLREVGGPYVDGNDSRTPFPVPPQAHMNCFSREEIVNEVLDLTDQVVSISPFGSIEVGKSFVALTLLHHNRTHAKFCGNLHFTRCDDGWEGFSLFNNAERLHGTPTNFSVRRCLVVDGYTNITGETQGHMIQGGDLR